jgi:hypothetical protein
VCLCAPQAHDTLPHLGGGLLPRPLADATTWVAENHCLQVAYNCVVCVCVCVLVPAFFSGTGIILDAYYSGRIFG